MKKYLVQFGEYKWNARIVEASSFNDAVSVVIKETGFNVRDLEHTLYVFELPFGKIFRVDSSFEIKEVK
jgi:hypothetical protein